MNRKKFLNLSGKAALFLGITSLAACDKNQYSKTEELLWRKVQREMLLV